MPRFKDLTGQTFGRLTAIKIEGRNRYKQAMWGVRCSCGVEKVLVGTSLTSGNTKSCGCLRIEMARGKGQNFLTHGMTKTPTYKSWTSMRNRCLNPNKDNFHNYGGRGITVCDRWKIFENFVADMGVRPDGSELDRINTDGNYEPGNCRWVTRKNNLRNKRNNNVITLDGVSLCVSEWAEISGAKRNTIYERLKRGWSDREAVYGRS